MKHFPPSELVLTNNNEVYHLGLKPENLAHKIILVGEPKRVELVSSFFDVIEHKSQHREFITHTGFFQGKRISVLSTGIGTDNIDIVINELDALVNIDLNSREEKKIKTSLEIIRIGTSGILHAEVPVLSYILSTYSFGLDNVAHFYDIHFSKEEIDLKNYLTKEIKLPPFIHPYLIASSLLINKKLKNEKVVEGITITGSGFYGPQGRELRLKLKEPEMIDSFSNFEINEIKINNFEMEGSALAALGKALGHECTTICLGIANRMTNAFSSDYNVEMKKLIQHVLERI